MSRPSLALAPIWSSRTVRWSWRTTLAALACVVAIVNLPGVAFAAWPLTVNQPLNTPDDGDFTFNLQVPRWNVVFLHPWSTAGFDEDLSVTGPGQLAQYGHTQSSTQSGNTMDFIALNNHVLPLGAYSATATRYSGDGSYQIIARTSSGTIPPHAFSSRTRFTTGAAVGPHGAYLGAIYDLWMPAGQKFIITTQTPGGVFLVSDYWTNDGHLPQCCVEVSGISRWLSLNYLHDDETCMTKTGNDQLYGFVILFRDGLTDDDGQARIFNVQTATEAQAEQANANGCRDSDFNF